MNYIPRPFRGRVGLGYVCLFGLTHCKNGTSPDISSSIFTT